MGIVKFALGFPRTFYVVAILILFLGISAIVSTPTDIFPQIRVPVVSIIWQYTGLSPDEMEQRVATYGEFAISSNVNGIKDMASPTLSGVVVGPPVDLTDGAPVQTEADAEKAARKAE